MIWEKLIYPFKTHNSTNQPYISPGEKASTSELIPAKEKGMQILKDVQALDAPKVSNINRRSKSALY